MAGFIPEKKIFKTENNLLIMQDGRTTSEEITVYDFYTKVNEFTKLLSADSTFLTFVSGAFPDNDSLNLFMDSISPLTKQIKAVQTMKQKKAKLTIPDPEHFKARFNYLSSLADNGQKPAIEAKKELAIEFGKAVTASISANKTSMLEFGITPPPEKEKKV